MKVRHVHIENFKGLKELDIDLTAADGNAPRRLTCLIGDNGSGKTTALQAIALTLSLATRRTESPTDFRWHGFLPERIGSLGPTFVQLIVDFDQDEIELTQRLFKEWEPSDRTLNRELLPGDRRQVTLEFKDGRIASPQGFGAMNQFLGRFFIKSLARMMPARRDHFAKLGDIFWFDQYRNLGTVLAGREPEGGDRSRELESWGVGVERLREFLVGWWAYFGSPANGQGKTYIKDLERKFAELFPGTQFRGTMPREGIAAPRTEKDFYFLLERDGRTYDLAEMASGEQAVFTLLYDFIRLNIARSVVLIDELELHLHPPVQQSLYAALPKLGSDCQFFITTHSEFLTGVIPNEQEVRIEGGRRCL